MKPNPMPANGEAPMIRTVGLVKHFGKLPVLLGIDEQVARGEVVSIIGPSGSGKSTFLRCLNRLEEPTGGKIFFEGVDITGKKADIDLHRQKMGMVFQQFNVFANLSVKQNITLAPVLLKGKPSLKRRRSRGSCSPAWGCSTSSTSGPAAFPAGRSSALPSCGRLPWNRT